MKYVDELWLMETTCHEAQISSKVADEEEIHVWTGYEELGALKQEQRVHRFEGFNSSIGCMEASSFAYRP